MRTIIDKIADTIAALPLEQGQKHPLRFIYEDAELQNITLDQVSEPFVAVTPIGSAAVSDDRGALHEQITIALWFGDQMCCATPDYDALENERIITACKRRAFRWWASLSPTRELVPVSVNGSQRAYLERDGYFTGYMLSVTLEEVEGVGRCQL